MKEISFIHCADLHLDSPLIGIRNLPTSIQKRLQESTFQALRKMVNTAIDRKVDFVLIAGDIYDGENRSIRAQIRFREEMNRLKEAAIPVYMIHGNHDHLNGDWVHIGLPDNVFVFPETVTTASWNKRNIKVNIYGFSYEKRHITERKVLDYKKEGNVDFHIGMLHGNLEGSKEHGNYAPFQLKELTETGMDYWALGHIHKRTVLSENPLIIYPGNTQGRHRKELEEKGCYLVTLTDGDSQIEFIPTSDVVFRSIIINVEGKSSFDEILALCYQAIAKEQKSGHGMILFIHLQHVSIHREFKANDLLEILQENEWIEDGFIWVSSVEVEEEIQWNKENLQHESTFFQELFNVSKEEMLVDKALASLYKTPSFHRFLPDLSIEEKEELLQQAEKQLVQQMLRARM